MSESVYKSVLGVKVLIKPLLPIGPSVVASGYYRFIRSAVNNTSIPVTSVTSFAMLLKFTASYPYFQKTSRSSSSSRLVLLKILALIVSSRKTIEFVVPRSPYG